MRKLITKKDFILVLIVLVVGAVGIILLNSADKGKTATIKVDGKVVETISLYEDNVIQLNGVVASCKNGEICVTESTCPDKVCVRSGKISKAGEGIICAPNRVSIEIDGENINSPDAMTG
ncbi:MAG: NusG domain II-containing protein [Clostridia bacterium]|nr:NusG domain II-containing protein [Clostridia bacterium]